MWYTNFGIDHLIGSVAAAQLLDGLVCTPGQLTCEVNAPSLVLGLCACMQGDACAGRV